MEVSSKDNLQKGNYWRMQAKHCSVKLQPRCSVSNNLMSLWRSGAPKNNLRCSLRIFAPGPKSFTAFQRPTNWLQRHFKRPQVRQTFSSNHHHRCLICEDISWTDKMTKLIKRTFMYTFVTCTKSWVITLDSSMFSSTLPGYSVNSELRFTPTYTMIFTF